MHLWILSNITLSILYFFFNLTPLLSLHTISKLRDDKALILHIANADQVPLLFAAFFLSIKPCLRSAIEVETMAIVGNPRVGTVSMLNWNTSGFSDAHPLLPGSCVRFNVITYFVEELAETLLCSRCSQVSWCRKNFAKSAPQKSRDKHSCTLGWEEVVLKQKQRVLFIFFVDSIFNCANLRDGD